jgi:hypothetical protein
MVSEKNETNSSSEINYLNIENKKEELLLDLVRKRYDLELQASRDLDSKAGNLIGYITIVTALIVGLGTFSILDKLSEPKYFIPYFVGIAALLFSIIISLFAIKTRKFYSSPAITDLSDYYNDINMNYKSVITQAQHRGEESHNRDI